MILLTSVYRQLMIRLSSITEAISFVFVFLLTIGLQKSFSEVREQHHHDRRSDKTKIRIVLLLIVLLALSAVTYTQRCYGHTDLLECFYIQPNNHLFQNIIIAIFINTTLYLGGLHQQLYNGGIKRKFLKFYKPIFQWNLFKRLFIVPVFLEWLYRGILNRLVNEHFEHNIFFMFFSASVFSASHLFNYFSFEPKHGPQKSMKAVLIQCAYNLIFGLYCSHIFVKRQALVSSVVVHIYGNFMGYPQYFQIFKGHLQDQRIRKTTVFYLVGILACLSTCLIL